MPAGLGATHADSVGQVVPCGDVRVMDDQGREVPRGESGELWIGGPMVVPGYWNNPTATQSAFVAGYWRSGDIGTMDGEGFVRIHDRMKDMINRGGYKIYSAEVENVMSHHPNGDRKCCCTDSRSGAWGKNPTRLSYPAMRNLSVDELRSVLRNTSFRLQSSGFLTPARTSHCRAMPMEKFLSANCANSH